MELTPEMFERVGKLCMCANLRQAARIITKIYDEFLQPAGVSSSQFILLGAIGANPSIAVTPLAEQLGMDPTTLARNLKVLERSGWVEVVKGADRRTRVVNLTEQGMAMSARALPFWQQAQAWVIEQIGEERYRTMLGDWSDMAALQPR
jgi:DNA-binding MarR family transcriptional regulator